MKLTKKLIPAFAMLLVSAVLMSTASFAWFSMNTQVTATDINVTADAPESLMISTTSASTGFGATVALSNANAITQIAPVTPYQKDKTTLNVVDGVQKFFKLTDAATPGVNENGALGGESAGADVAENTYYTDATTSDVFNDKVWIKLEGTTTQKQLKVAATWTTEPSEAIKGAFHVLFTDKDGNKLLDLDMTNAGTATDLTQITGGASATEINIYVYLYGGDEDCKNADITADAVASIKLTFTYA